MIRRGTIGDRYVPLRSDGPENGITGLLAGGGGDEIFVGNTYTQTPSLRYKTSRDLLRRGLLEPVLAALPDGQNTVIAEPTLRSRANIPNPRRFYSYEFFFARAGRDLLASDFLSSLDPESPWRCSSDTSRAVRPSDD